MQHVPENLTVQLYMPAPSASCTGADIGLMNSVQTLGAMLSCGTPDMLETPAAPRMPCLLQGYCFVERSGPTRAGSSRVIMPAVPQFRAWLQQASLSWQQGSADIVQVVF